MPHFSTLSSSRLATCDMRLQGILREAIKYIDFTVLEGHRGEAAQEDAFRRGASHVHWPHGAHNVSPSRAVDIAPYPLIWKDTPRFAFLMGYIRRIADVNGVRLRFGMDRDGDGVSVPFDPDEHLADFPHIELVDV